MLQFFLIMVITKQAGYLGNAVGKNLFVYLKPVGDYTVLFWLPINGVAFAKYGDSQRSLTNDNFSC